MSLFQTTNNKLIGTFLRKLTNDISCRHKSGALPSSKCVCKSFINLDRVKSPIVSRTFLYHKFGAFVFNTTTTISFLLYPVVLPSFFWWDKLTKFNRCFYLVLPITPLILKLLLNKLVWSKYPSSLMEGIYVIPVEAARVPVSVLPFSYWFCCSCVELFRCHILHPLVLVALVGWPRH